MVEKPGTGPTALIVVAADLGRLDEAAGRMAEELAVERDMAVQILKGAPILFITGLTKAEVRTLTPRLQKISEAGVEFRMTQSPPAQVAKINWPIRPAFTSGDGPTAGAAIAWDGSTFSCPGCGESFAVRRLNGATAPAHAKAAPPPKAALPDPVEEPMSVNPVQSVGGDALDDAVDMMADLGGEPPPAPPPAPAPEPATVPGDDLGNLDDLLSSDQGDPLDLDTAFGTEAPAEAAPAAEPAIDDLGGDDLLSSMEAQEQAPVAAVAAPPEDEGGERFNVFIASLKDDTRQAAAKLIADFRKIPLAEAVALTKRAMIKAADKVGKTAAEKLVHELKKIKISARMTKATG